MPARPALFVPSRSTVSTTLTLEQRTLRTSIAVTVLVAGFGIAFGLLSGSFSIAFDGMYALADASMSVLALLVTNLIAAYAAPQNNLGRLQQRFTMGFWHLEPIVLGLNGTLLVGVSIYALVNAVSSLLTGGRELAFGLAIVYAAVTLALCIFMAVHETRINRQVRSELLALDAKAWVMSGGITAALLAAFCIGYALEGTRWQWLSPYIDPAVLALVCVVIIPMPIGAIRQAFSDILLVTPESLRHHVRDVAQAAVQRHGFLSYRAYVAKVGRARQIELYFIVPPDWPAMRIQDWDRIRDDIGDALGGEGPDRWLTIAFTADIEWAT